MSSTCNQIGADTGPVSFRLVGDRCQQLISTTSRYEIGDELGRGGMGIVYRARDLSLNRDIAVKVFPGSSQEHPRAYRQFVNEAMILGALQHPGIVTVYECGHTDLGQPFHTMKLVDGTTLFHLLGDNSSDRQPPARHLKILADVCQAMAFTHSRNILHLDLKPSNIMVCQFGVVHVTDWGLAQSLEPDSGFAWPEEVDDRHESEFSGEVHVRGTPEYMAPEQANAAAVDKRTDVFCLGGILCEILTGLPPYQGDAQYSVMDQAKQSRLDPAFERLDRCTGEPRLSRLARHCLQPLPQDRPEDAAEVANAMACHTESVSQQIETDMTRFFELSLDLFCIAGFDGFFHRINDNFSRVLGFQEHELLSRPFLDFVVAEDREKTIEVMGGLIKGQSVVRFRNRYRTAGGSCVKFEWTAKSIVNEKVIFAVARDIT